MAVDSRCRGSNPVKAKNVSLSTAFRPALWPSQSLIQQVPEVHSSDKSSRATKLTSNLQLDRDVGKTVSCWIPTVLARVRTRFKSTLILWRIKGGTNVGFLQVPQFQLSVLPLAAQHTSSFIIPGC
jgi:hypothetical protein